MTVKSITQSRLKEVLHYNPDTGVFTWIKSLNGRAPVGKIADNQSTDGYVRIRIDKQLYFAHRLAFLYMAGKFPEYQSDHINHVRTDNRWCNLREATHQENGKNQCLQPTNKSGTPGVIWLKKRKAWHATIKVNGKNIYILESKDKDKVITARKQAEIKYGFHPNHGVRVTTA